VVLLIQSSPEARKAGFLFWDGERVHAVLVHGLSFRRRGFEPGGESEVYLFSSKASEEVAIAPEMIHETTLQK
jgi:hypothetical protein